jgi:hypothetical protein
VAERFAISYGRAFEPLATLTGTGARYSGVELDEETLRVRMGWAFRAAVPRASIASAGRGDDVRMTRGVHGWRGDWLVNGDGNGIVELRLDPAARASMSGVPIRLERLRVSLEDPDGFLAALGLSVGSRS